MLREVASTAQVVVCSTCRHSAEARQGADGRRGGAALADAMRQVRADDPAFAAIDIAEMACLFACDRHCAVHLRAPGKIGYVLGNLAPDGDAARAVLEFAAAHADSAEGVVAYAQWPEGVRSHFLVRIPPEGFVAE